MPKSGTAKRKSDAVPSSSGAHKKRKLDTAKGKAADKSRVIKEKLGKRNAVMRATTPRRDRAKLYTGKSEGIAKKLPVLKGAKKATTTPVPKKDVPPGFYATGRGFLRRMPYTASKYAQKGIVTRAKANGSAESTPRKKRSPREKYAYLPRSSMVMRARTGKPIVVEPSPTPSTESEDKSSPVPERRPNLEPGTFLPPPLTVSAKGKRIGRPPKPRPVGFVYERKSPDPPINIAELPYRATKKGKRIGRPPKRKWTFWKSRFDDHEP